VSQARIPDTCSIFHGGQARPEINDTLYFISLRDSESEILILGTYFMAALYGNTDVDIDRTYKPLIFKMLPFSPRCSIAASFAHAKIVPATLYGCPETVHYVRNEFPC